MVEQDTQSSTQNPSFSQFGRPFQEKVVQALLIDSRWAEQMTEVMDSSYFDLKYLQFVVDRHTAYAKKYKSFPTMQILIAILRDDLKGTSDQTLRGQIVEYLQRMRSDPDLGDLPYVREKSLEFCRKQALRAALESAVDDIEANKYEAIVDRLKKAVAVGTPTSAGLDLATDIDARYSVTARNPVPTGHPALDAKGMLSGGLGRGELGVIVAPTGVGKSHELIDIGAHAVSLGINVAQFTFELSEAQILKRYDARLIDIDFDDLEENRARVDEFYQSNGAKLGTLKVKYYPSGTATVFMLRAWFERQALTGFRPGLIIIDYADIMRSSRQYDQLRMELKLVYEELRALAGEMALPIWTASQSNKEGSSSEIVDLGNMSEAYGKAMVADVVLGLSRRPQEKALGLGRLYVAKNRAGRDGIVFPIKIDTARSRITITGASGTIEETKTEDVGTMKSRLRRIMDERADQLRGDGIPVGEPHRPPREPRSDT